MKIFPLFTNIFLISFLSCQLAFASNTPELEINSAQQQNQTDPTKPMNQKVLLGVTIFIGALLVCLGSILAFWFTYSIYDQDRRGECGLLESLRNWRNPLRSGHTFYVIDV